MAENKSALPKLQVCKFAQCKEKENNDLENQRRLQQTKENDVTRTLAKLRNSLELSDNEQVYSKTSFQEHNYAKTSVPPMAISVTVKVEEVDQPNDTATQHHLTKGQKEDKRDGNEHSLQVDIDKLYSVADHISKTSDKYADKYLSIELKHMWGRAQRLLGDHDPHNDLIQASLRTWSAHAAACDKQPPCIYQCQICKISWWYLYTFREHIRMHDPEGLNVFLNKNILIASYTVSTDIHTSSYLPCEGDCYRCGNPYDYHRYCYVCIECEVRLPDCVEKKNHTYICSKSILPRSTLYFQCTICSNLELSQDLMDKHLRTAHPVRSDVVAPIVSKQCPHCRLYYNDRVFHNCPKKSALYQCRYCLEKFCTKQALALHTQLQEKRYRCEICYVELDLKCAKASHMLTHTDKYKMVYKCSELECSLIFFESLCYMKSHLIDVHKKTKYDRVKHKIIVPDVSKYKFTISVSGESGDEQELPTDSIKIKEEVTNECETGYEVVDEDEDIINQLMFIDHGENEETLIGNKSGQQEIKKETESDMEYEDMDYMTMLSKVFKLPSDNKREADTSVKKTNSRKCNDQPTAPLQTPSKEMCESSRSETRPTAADVPVVEVKAEPIEYSSMDIEDDPITLKEEPIEACFGSLYYNNFGLDTATTSKTEDQNCSSNNESCSNAELKVNNKIKTEPETDTRTDVAREEQVFDDIAANLINDLKQEDTYEDANISRSNVSTSPKKKLKVPKHKKQMITVLSATDSGFKLEKLVKKNMKVSSVAQRFISTELDKPDIVVKTVRKKYKKATYDEDGKRIKKKYKCEQCGYVDIHRLFALHKQYGCQLKGDAAAMATQYKCTKCSRTFDKFASFATHFISHGYRRRQCPVCALDVRPPLTLATHMWRHLTENYVKCFLLGSDCTMKKRQKCIICHNVVEWKEFFIHWEQHLQLRPAAKVKSNDVKPVIVTKQSGSESESDLEIVLDEVEEVPIPIADVSGVRRQKSMELDLLKKALKLLTTAHCDKECVVCSYSSDRRQDVKRHVIEHLLTDAYSRRDRQPTSDFRCQLCGELWERPEQYKFHMREHAALAVYRCELCDRCFSDSSNFAKHKKIHNSKALICDFCKKKFNSKGSLETHMLIHMTTDPFVCKCKRVFFDLAKYKKHLRQKEQKQPGFLKCKQCVDTTFASLREKWDHEWLVHRVRKLKADCPACPLKFRRYMDLKQHAKLIHDISLVNGDIVPNVNKQTVRRLRK